MNRRSAPQNRGGILPPVAPNAEIGIDRVVLPLHVRTLHVGILYTGTAGDRPQAVQAIVFIDERGGSASAEHILLVHAGVLLAGKAGPLKTITGRGNSEA